MNKLAQAVTRWCSPRAAYSLLLSGMTLGVVAMPALAQTRMVNSDGEVIIIERPKPTSALRSRWIKPEEVGKTLRAPDEPDEQAVESGEQEPLGNLFEVLGRNAPPVEVDIPMALDASEEASDQPTPVRLSSRIEVLGRDSGDELPQLLAELLRDSGEQLVEFKLVDVQVSTDQIRYFHDSDRSHAEYVASLLNGVFESLPVRDYSFFRPSPPEGLLEIWIQ